MWGNAKSLCAEGAEKDFLEKLLEGWLKLNIDGSVEGGSGLACCGRAIRDANG